MSIDPSRTVAELVLERPSRTRVFEQLGLDYCCGGKRSLADACVRRDVALDVAVAALDAADGSALESEDWTLASVAQLVDHVVAVHHGLLRTELPRLSGLLAKCKRAHGTERPDLVTMAATFEALRRELEHHMLDEEQRLFPACLDGRAPEAALLHHLEEEHSAAGELLEQLRALGGDYELETALCNTHRAALDGLRELELDLHQHIHEENNILFPRVAARAAAPDS